MKYFSTPGADDALQEAMGPVLDWDQQTQSWIEGFSGGWLDGPMHVLSTLGYFMPALIGAWGWLVWRGGAKGRALALVALVLVFVTDFGSAGILKPLFARPRPHSDAFGFPSSHASNMFGQAMLFSCAYSKLTPVFVLLASLVGLSRVYLGKHYPLDVLAGALFGAGCGYLAWRVSKRTDLTETLWKTIFAKIPGAPRDLEDKTR